ncbi:hypothetical protein [Candidatus Halobonum tyrrellensis]|uniref:Right handed beta helix domain-containing protein n=1 Tax=Candidatus Halobonum tyrrellensis G22 TaxID=1324957 RepID=V4HKC7_9EURY|nr:hypothetical protein [Candidatus Halobonum tyrrellensis]ESP88349.1 hypothetical protein K933_09507 [Candidatus Halobonum tyrrellensis G22]
MTPDPDAAPPSFPGYDAEHRVVPASDGRTTLDLDSIAPGADVVLPDGDVHLRGQFAADGAGAVRFRAATGAEPTLVVPPDYNRFAISVAGEHFVFDGIDVDVGEETGVAGIRAHADTLLVRDVAFVGRGTHPDGEVTNCFNLAVTHPDGTGVVRDVVAAEGSTWARYKGGDGRIWAWVGGDHVGELRVQRCRVEEFGNNGIYGSEAPGRVVVERCAFWNNNVASIRVGADGCTVRGTVVGVDPARYAGPREPARESESFFMRGLWVEAKRGALDSPGRVTLDRSRVVVRGGDGRADASGDASLPTGVCGVVVRPNAGALDVRDADVRVDAPGVPPILAKRPGTAGPHASTDPPHDVTLERTRVVDTARVDALVSVTGRDLTVGDGCCLEGDGDGTDGVAVADGACSVGACTVRVPGEAVRAPASRVDRSRVDTDGTCDGEWGSVEAAPPVRAVDLPGVPPA